MYVSRKREGTNIHTYARACVSVVLSDRRLVASPSANVTGLRASVAAQGWATEAEARLQALNGKRVAVGGDFNPRCVLVFVCV